MVASHNVSVSGDELHHLIGKNQMRWISRIAFALGVIGTLTSAQAGIIGLDPSSRDFWDSHAIVVATIDHAKNHAKDAIGSEQLLSIRVLRVVQTDLPIDTQMTIPYVAFDDLPDQAIGRSIPAVGGTYLLCLEFRDDSWLLVMNYLYLFQSRTVLERVHDVSDRMVRRAEAESIWAHRRAMARTFAEEAERLKAEHDPEPAAPRKE